MYTKRDLMDKYNGKFFLDKQMNLCFGFNSSKDCALRKNEFYDDSEQAEEDVLLVRVMPLSLIKSKGYYKEIEL